MRGFCARWPDGSFSIVDAEDETDALIQLDELGDEPAELWPIQSCLVDFELTDDGTFRLKQFGEQTAPEILRNATKAERRRLKDFQRTSGTTERGKDFQRQVGGSGAYVDTIVEQAASQHLRRYKPRKKSKPN